MQLYPLITMAPQSSHLHLLIEMLLHHTTESFVPPDKVTITMYLRPAENQISLEDSLDLEVAKR